MAIKKKVTYTVNYTAGTDTLTTQLNSLLNSIVTLILNQNITNQGYEARLQAQALTGVLSAQHAELLKAISDENCRDRELMRQIQTEGIAGALADAKAKNAILEQNQYLVAQLKTTAAG